VHLKGFSPVPLVLKIRYQEIIAYLYLGGPEISSIFGKDKKN